MTPVPQFPDTTKRRPKRHIFGGNGRAYFLELDGLGWYLRLGRLTIWFR